jgi:hypothetical protein
VIVYEMYADRHPLAERHRKELRQCPFSAVKRKTFTLDEYFAFCEGLRTPAPACAAPPSPGRHPQTFTIGDTARTQGANRICRQAAGNCERVIGGPGFAVDGSA